MRRRVARVLRGGLLVLGCALLLCLPVSFLYAFNAVGRRGGVTGSHAVVHVRWVYGSDPLPQWALEPRPQFGFEEASFFPPSGHVFPRIMQQSAADFGRLAGVHRTDVFFPLWLLAFICLAWPVTSLILARRKPKRGFPVEPKAGGEDVSPPVSSS